MGHGARQVLDAHPARLADLLMDRQRRHLLRPVAALTKAEGPSAHSLFVPLTLYRAARRLARTSYRTGLETAAGLLPTPTGTPPTSPRPPPTPHWPLYTWSRPGPAARWLTGEALAEVSVRLQAAAIRPTSVQRPGEARARAALARSAADHRILEQAAEIRHQRLRAPFLDNQVVRAARALPESLRVQPGARAAILRRVLGGAGIHDLPPGWGTPSQATSTAVTRTGLRTALPELMALFDAPLLADAVVGGVPVPAATAGVPADRARVAPEQLLVGEVVPVAHALDQLGVGQPGMGDPPRPSRWGGTAYGPTPSGTASPASASTTAGHGPGSTVPPSAPPVRRSTSRLGRHVPGGHPVGLRASARRSDLVERLFLLLVTAHRGSPRIHPRTRIPAKTATWLNRDGPSVLATRSSGRFECESQTLFRGMIPYCSACRNPFTCSPRPPARPSRQWALRPTGNPPGGPPDEHTT
ncbi:hypothetical protein SCALM49S_07267 [Streptomyces californicus]